MVINLSKCTRCHACVAACRVEHFLPLHITWPRLAAWEQELERGLDVTTYPVRCNHCKDAPCVKVCPTKATNQRQDGIVWVDQNKCVGCRYCIIACPYQNRTTGYRQPFYFLSQYRNIPWLRSFMEYPTAQIHQGQGYAESASLSGYSQRCLDGDCQLFLSRVACQGLSWTFPF